MNKEYYINLITDINIAEEIVTSFPDDYKYKSTFLVLLEAAKESESEEDWELLRDRLAGALLNFARRQTF